MGCPDRFRLPDGDHQKRYCLFARWSKKLLFSPSSGNSVGSPPPQSICSTRPLSPSAMPENGKSSGQPQQSEVRANKFFARSRPPSPPLLNNFGMLYERGERQSSFLLPPPRTYVLIVNHHGWPLARSLIFRDFLWVSPRRGRGI